MVPGTGTLKKNPTSLSVCPATSVFWVLWHDFLTEYFHLYSHTIGTYHDILKTDSVLKPNSFLNILKTNSVPTNILYINLPRTQKMSS